MSDHVFAPQQDVVLLSSVRISRNYRDIPFASNMNDIQIEDVIDRTSRMVFKSPNGASYMLMRLKDMGEEARKRLFEHHLISNELLSYSRRGAVMVSSAGTISVMMNEEDHIRFQGLLPGSQLERCAEMALNLEEFIEQEYDYAYDTKWGYQTARPSNAGTGMRASIVMHLPALADANQIASIAQDASRSGMTITGLYTKGRDHYGDLYRLSNTATIGLSEEDIIQGLIEASEEICDKEREAREACEKNDMLQLQDELMRSWGEVLHARLMPTGDFLNRISDIRYAASLGYIHLPIPALDELIKDLQTGSLNVRAGHILEQREVEIQRARILREELLKLNRANKSEG